jgi:hypothetical protein
MISRVKEYAKSRLRRAILSLLQDDLRSMVTSAVAIADQVHAYRVSTKQERQSYYEGTRGTPLSLKDRFIAAHIPVQTERIDLADFEEWLRDFEELDGFYGGSDVHIEKCLEHYLAFKWLGLGREDVYIDVGSAGSIWADVLNQRGITAYKLDLVYPPGIQGQRIGADAGDTRLPSGFASAMSLQCAFETFQGNADSRFVREAERVLKDRGRIVILPLYTDETFFILSSPYVDLSRVELDPGAIRVWREDPYKEPFSRHYSPEAFAERIYTQIGEMKGKIVLFTNRDDVRARYPGQRIYCDFMFYCQK